MSEQPNPRPGDAPVACSLEPRRLADRLGEWRALADSALLSRTEAEGRVIAEFERRDDVRRRLGSLIAAERECCGFLEFAVRETEDVIRLEVAGPPGAERVLELASTSG